MSTKHEIEPRAGEARALPAIVLGSVPYQETGRIVHLFTAEFGKIHALAPGAVNSRKRFGGALDAMSFIQAHVSFPRNFGKGEGGLVRFARADIRDSFLHLRTSLALLDTGLFVVRLIDVFLPEGYADPHLFRATGRFLRDLSVFGTPIAPHTAGWCRFAFWNWLSHRLGHGDLAPPPDFAPLSTFWPRMMESTEPPFKEFFELLAHTDLPPFGTKEESQLYTQWTASSGQHWPKFEAWIGERGAWA